MSKGLTHGERELAKSHLIDLLVRARPFVYAEAEAFRGFNKEMADCAEQLLKDIDDAVRS